MSVDFKEYTVREYANGSIHWFFNGRLHRENGPAVERWGGDKHWYLNGDLHREDGPAMEYADGNKHWYLNGDLHREDGPAIEWVNGRKEWYLNGECMTEEQHRQQTQTCSGKVVEIDGKKYKLTEV